VAEEIRKSGLDALGLVSWGTHLCQFYQTKEDLTQVALASFGSLASRSGQTRPAASIYEPSRLS